jgi:hypothetical protein
MYNLEICHLIFAQNQGGITSEHPLILGKIQGIALFNSNLYSAVRT